MAQLALADKRCSLAEAVGLIRDGDTVGIGGMTLYRRPTALVRELIRRGRRGLDLFAFTGSYECDLLVGTGAVERVRTCYFGLESFGLAPMFTAAATAGRIQVPVETEASLAIALRAALAGVDFLPYRSACGTDVPNARPDLRWIASPYSGERYLAAPAFRPRVALIHAPLADRAGNATLGGQYALDRELALAAEVVVVSAEAIVDTSIIEVLGADVLGLKVTAVVEAPMGSHPASCWPGYGVDGAALLDYLDACRSGAFAAYVAERADPRTDEASYQSRWVPAEGPRISAARIQAWSEALADLHRSVQRLDTGVITV